MISTPDGLRTRHERFVVVEIPHVERARRSGTLSINTLKPFRPCEASVANSNEKKKNDAFVYKYNLGRDSE